MTSITSLTASLDVAMQQTSLVHYHRQTATSEEVSRHPQGQAFQAAFLDQETGMVYRSRFRSGQPAPMHLVDGLPEQLILARDAQGRVRMFKPTLVAGFLCQGRFLTRSEAAARLRA